MHNQRLLQLANDLVNNADGLDMSDFMGCALSRCPHLWPRQWRVDRWGRPVLRGRTQLSPGHSAAVWFDLRGWQVSEVFGPSANLPRGIWELVVDSLIGALAPELSLN